MPQRSVVAFLLAAVTGAALHFRFPVAWDNSLLNLMSIKAPVVHYVLTRSYLLFLYTTPLIVYSTIISLVFTHIYNPAGKATGSGKLPPYPKPEDRKDLYVVLGEQHHATKPEPSESPTWFVIPEKGLVTGVACFGAIGSGKTSALIRPLALQLFAYAATDPKRRIGGIVLEVKGDFCEQVREMLTSVGRGDDYIEMSTSTHYRYNPLANPDLDEDALAYGITTLIANIYGKSKDPFWPMASTNAIKFLILLHRLVYGYCTLLDVYHSAIDPDLLAKKIEAGAKLFGITREILITAEVFNANLERLQNLNWPWSDELNAFHLESTPEVVQTITKKPAIPHKTELSVGKTDQPADKRDQFEAVERWFKHDWTAIDVKLRTSIVEGISVFLSLFDTNPSVKQVFCPPKDVYDPEKNPSEAGYPLGQPFPPFADLIEEGRVVALNFPVALNPIIAKTIGVLMKLDYQRAVILRIPKMSDPAKKGHHWRPTVFCVDEYQNFVTTGESGTGDQNFFSLSRQPKCIGIVATQSIVSLKGALGSDDAYKTLLQTFRTKVFLGTADDVTAKYASDLGGTEDKLQMSVNVSESSQDASVSVLTGHTVGSKSSVSTSRSYSARQLPRFDMKGFYTLKNAQAIVIGFDGVNPMPASYVYLKPYFLPVDQSWFAQYGSGALK